MQSESTSIGVTNSSEMNEVSSKSGPSDKLAKQSSGSGRGRGKKQVRDGDEGNIGVDPRQEQVAASYHKATNEKQRKQVTDKIRKTRKPDQALYVPRSQRNQENKSPVSRITGKETEKTEREVKRSQKDQHEPPHKKQIIAKNESPTMTAHHMTPVTVQEGEKKADENVESLDAAMFDKEHKDLIDSNDAPCDVSNILVHSTLDHDPKDNDHPICKNNVTKSPVPSGTVPGEVEPSEGTQSNLSSAMEVEPQDIDSINLSENMLCKLTEETCSDARISSSNHVNDDSTNKYNTLEKVESSTSTVDHGEMVAVSASDPADTSHQTVSAESAEKFDVDFQEKPGRGIDELNLISQGHTHDIATKETYLEEGINEHSSTNKVHEVENLSNIVDQDIGLPQEQNDLDEDHSAIKVETHPAVDENTEAVEKYSLENDERSEPHDGNEPTIEESMDVQNEKDDTIKELEENIADPEPSIDNCSGDTAVVLAPTSDALTTGGGSDEEEDDWEALFDDSGEALLNDVVDEISDAIGNVNVSVKKSKQDYCNYQPKDNFDYGKFNHVIEIYDFPAEFRMEDLIQSFSGYRIKGFDLKWVDDTHALGVFQSLSTAQDALSIQNPMLRTRPLAQATRESKLKARNFVDFLQPPRPRPETSASAARRLVSGALGIKSKESKEQKAAEMKKLKDAKEKKRADKRLTEDIWEGTLRL